MGSNGTVVSLSFSRASLGLIFVGAGVLHFLGPETYEWIMPPYLPLQRELVYLSGAVEILGGLGMLSERTRPAAGIVLILLLLAVWPANLQMLLDARANREPSWWISLLWARMPLQILLIWWVWRASRPRP